MTIITYDITVYKCALMTASELYDVSRQADDMNV